ncbi:MAG: FprA family A-type flavoprotein [Marinilabiliaceae bacterium]|jgi:flavorubredoxin|nr:FprA family A-type flavoprotein [Marinilabiliaceae bacterium]
MNKTDNRVLGITDDVKWIGILDYEIVTFDIVMETEFGTTYNSYFINADKKAIIETAKAKFSETYINKIKSVCNPSEIEYIILNHTEPDHSGALKDLLDLAPEATVVGSGNAIRYLSDMINIPFRSIAVKDGETLDLGNKTLRFISAPNLHWPDSIYTYLEEDRILFTCDSFGAHYCDEEMFDDKVADYSDAFKYYFDVILKPFSRFMLKAIEKIQSLDIDVVCPGHGPILRSGWKEKVELSEKYAREYLDITKVDKVKKVLITYVSAYGYTKEMAEIIKIGLEGVSDTKVSLLDIENIDLGELESEVVKADGILVGSPTINQNTLLPVYRLFSVINPLRDKNKHAAAFGSYGWSGEAAGIIADNLRNLKLKVMDDLGKFKFSPDEEKRIELVAFGSNFARQLANCE